MAPGPLSFACLLFPSYAQHSQGLRFHPPNRILQHVLECSNNHLRRSTDSSLVLLTAISFHLFSGFRFCQMAENLLISNYFCSLPQLSKMPQSQENTLTGHAFLVGSGDTNGGNFFPTPVLERSPAIILTPSLRSGCNFATLQVRNFRF